MKKKYLTLILSMAFVLCAFQLNAQKKYEDNTGTRSNEVQRVYIDFTSLEGAVRHLLLGFTPNNEATDGFDFGYDAPNADVLPDDLNWIIEDERYIIQGVGAFENTKSYPFGMYLEHSGVINIALVSLENFDEPIDVFVHDTLNDTYTKINDADFTETIDSGDYINRFRLCFKDPNEVLSVSDHALGAIKINYQKNNDLLIIDAQNIAEIKGVDLFSVHGQKLLESKDFNDRKIQLALNSINHDVIIVGIETSKGISHRKIALLH